MFTTTTHYCICHDVTNAHMHPVHMNCIQFGCSSTKTSKTQVKQMHYVRLLYACISACNCDDSVISLIINKKRNSKINYVIIIMEVGYVNGLAVSILPRRYYCFKTDDSSVFLERNSISKTTFT